MSGESPKEGAWRAESSKDRLGSSKIDNRRSSEDFGDTLYQSTYGPSSRAARSANFLKIA